MRIPILLLAALPLLPSCGGAHNEEVANPLVILAGQFAQGSLGSDYEPQKTTPTRWDPRLHNYPALPSTPPTDAPPLPNPLSPLSPLTPKTAQPPTFPGPTPW